MLINEELNRISVFLNILGPAPSSQTGSSQAFSSQTSSSDNPTVENLSSSFGECIIEGESEDTDCSSPLLKRRRGIKNIFTPKVIAALDKSKISDRNAVLLIVAVLEAAELDVNDFIINKSSVQRHRNIVREKRFNQIKAEFRS